MISLTLSDHTTDVLNRHEASIQAENQARSDRYTQQFNHLQHMRAVAWNDMASSFRASRFWSAFCAFLLVLRLSRKNVAPAFVQSDAYDNSMRAMAAGNQGEASVLQALNNQLSYEWTAIKGFKSRKGEIDLVVIGPHGIAAIEIKYVNGTCYCDGDRWWRDKYDNYDNLVESDVPIADKGGRSPARQVNDSADELVSVLKRGGVNAPVARFVVLAHEKSLYGKFTGYTVDGIFRTEDLNLALECSKHCQPNTAERAARVISLIQADHKRGATQSRRNTSRPCQSV